MASPVLLPPGAGLFVTHDEFWLLFRQVKVKLRPLTVVSHTRPV